MKDPLEAELAAMRPHEPSLGLQQRIAERLTESPPSRARWLRGVALAAALAAACLAVVILLRRGPVGPTGRTTVPVPAPHAVLDDSLPTLQVYRRALDGSPEQLDALLDRHAGRASKGARIYAFPRSDLSTLALTGEP